MNRRHERSLTAMRVLTGAWLAVFVLGLAGVAFQLAALPTCVTEDSTNCRWTADVQGNGIGQSFIDVFGVTIPLP